MPNGSSLHIGLNHVDAPKYNNWPGTLAGCINDANAMQKIAASQGFVSSMLIDENATAGNVIAAINAAAASLKSGDTMLVSYSGHGPQVPDTTGESDNGLDSTWVCFDRMLLGHELYALWANFAPGVHIEVYSDSCHSGTVIRDLVFPGGGFPAAQLPAMVRVAPAFAALEYRQSAVPAAAYERGLPPALAAVNAPHRSPAAAFDAVFGNVLRSAGTASPLAATIALGALNAVPRMMPVDIAFQVYHQNSAMYEALRQPRAPITAGVILISACQDNQVAQDGAVNGLFTEKLLSIWNDGAFTGTLPQFHGAIVALMPPTQTPNYFHVGVDDAALAQSKPLAIVAGASAAAVASASPVDPTIAGPATLNRDTDGAPAFTVVPGSNPYYIVEVATDTACFGDPSKRTASNFYGSWDDASAPKRFTGGTYTLPDAAWSALKAADALYYRAGSTSSQTAWDDYRTSTRDDAAANAPSIRIASSATNSATAPAASGPAITGPASFAADSATGPAFTVTTSRPYFVVEATNDPTLFAAPSRRTAGTFYASWSDPNGTPRLTGTSYTLPADVWQRLAAAGTPVFYRAGETSSATAWDDYVTSTADDVASTAPSIVVMQPVASNGVPVGAGTG